jgi:hypothetical protein
VLCLFICLVLFVTDARQKLEGKDEAVPRRSGRSFKAPRPVKARVPEIITVTETETNDSEVQVEKETVQEIITVTETETNDSQVQVITETENDRNIQARAVAKPELLIERAEDRTIESDTTGSTPDCCKSPDMDLVRVTVHTVPISCVF